MLEYCGTLVFENSFVRQFAIPIEKDVRHRDFRTFTDSMGDDAGPFMR